MAYGTYFSSPKLNILYNEHSANDLNNKPKNLLVRFLNLFLNKRFQINTDELNPIKVGNVLFRGVKLLMSNKGIDNQAVRNFRIFDFDNFLVLSYFYYTNQFENYIQCYNIAQHYYKLPELMFFDQTKQVVVEKYIQHKNSNFSEIANYASFFNQYQNNLRNYLQDDKQNIFYKYIPEIQYKSQISEVNKKIEEINKIRKQFTANKLPYYFQHGDLNKTNILITEENQFYIIDWEYADIYLCFYDLFWIPMILAIWESDFSLIDYVTNSTHYKELKKILNLEINDRTILTAVGIEMFNKRVIPNATNIDDYMNNHLYPYLQKVLEKY